MRLAILSMLLLVVHIRGEGENNCNFSSGLTNGTVQSLSKMSKCTELKGIPTAGVSKAYVKLLIGSGVTEDQFNRAFANVDTISKTMSFSIDCNGNKLLSRMAFAKMKSFGKNEDRFIAAMNSFTFTSCPNVHTISFPELVRDQSGGTKLFLREMPSFHEASMNDMKAKFSEVILACVWFENQPKDDFNRFSIKYFDCVNWNANYPTNVDIELGNQKFNKVFNRLKTVSSNITSIKIKCIPKDKTKVFDFKNLVSVGNGKLLRIEISDCQKVENIRFPKLKGVYKNTELILRRMSSLKKEAVVELKKKYTVYWDKECGLKDEKNTIDKEFVDKYSECHRIEGMEKNDKSVSSFLTIDADTTKKMFKNSFAKVKTLSNVKYIQFVENNLLTALVFPELKFVGHPEDEFFIEIVACPNVSSISFRKLRKGHGMEIFLRDVPSFREDSYRQLKEKFPRTSDPNCALEDGPLYVNRTFVDKYSKCSTWYGKRSAMPEIIVNDSVTQNMADELIRNVSEIWNVYDLAFQNNKLLKYLTFAQLKLSDERGLEFITFHRCPNLVNIVFSKLEILTSTVLYMQGMNSLSNNSLTKMKKLFPYSNEHVIEECIFPESITKVSQLSPCHSVTNLTFAPNVTGIVRTNITKLTGLINIVGTHLRDIDFLKTLKELGSNGCVIKDNEFCVFNETEWTSKFGKGCQISGNKDKHHCDYPSQRTFLDSNSDNPLLLSDFLLLVASWLI